MKLQGKRVLVTGADGFIGSHLVEHLVKIGADVRAFVYYNSFNSWGWLDHSDDRVKRAIDVFAGDIRDPHGVRVAMQGCDVVLHLAALIAIPYSYHSPDTYVDTNVKRLIRRGAMLFDVRDAKIDVAPLEGWPAPEEVATPPKTIVPVIAPPPEPLILPVTKTA